MRSVTVRLADGLFERLEDLAADRGIDRSTLLRRLIDEAAPLPEGTPAIPDDAELLTLLAEQARSGNVGAMRILLDRRDRDRDLDIFDLAES